MSNINKSRGKTKPLGYVKEMCGILKKKSTQNKPQTQNYKKIKFFKKISSPVHRRALSLTSRIII